MNCVGGVFVSVLVSNAENRGIEFLSGQIKYYKIGMCCFSVKHKGLRSKNKDWLTRNQNNVSEWSDMSTHRLLLQWASAIKNPTKRVGLIVQIYAGFIIITSKSIFFSQ
jgi:uncharacterized protein (UPF0303 family)